MTYEKLYQDYVQANSMSTLTIKQFGQVVYDMMMPRIFDLEDKIFLLEKAIETASEAISDAEYLLMTHKQGQKAGDNEDYQ